jgi:hypothetical protein
MSRSLRKAREWLANARSLVSGVLIGSAMATPAFAATGIALDDLHDLQLPILVGSLVLLVIGLNLKAAQHRRTPTQPPPARAPAFTEGIDRYRLQLGRGDAD